MRPWLGLCHRLVMSSVLSGLLLPWTVLISIDAIAALTSELDEFDQGEYNIGIATGYVALSIPRRAYELFPSAAVIGCLLGLGGLAATSQLTVMQAAGVSRRRMGFSVSLVIGTMALGMAAVGETIAPWGDRLGEAWVVAAKTGGTTLLRKNDLWARDGNDFVNAKQGIGHEESGANWLELKSVSIYSTAEDGRLAGITTADRAEYRSGRWTLHQGRRQVFNEHSVDSASFETLPWDSGLNPNVLQFSFNSARYQSLNDLDQQIDHAIRNGMDERPLREAYWAKVFYPIHALTLSLAALPFAFGSQRSGGAGKRLFVGIVFGLGFWLCQRLFITIANIEGVDLRVANLMIPTAVALAALATARLRRA